MTMGAFIVFGAVEYFSLKRDSKRLGESFDKSKQKTM